MCDSDDYETEKRLLHEALEYACANGHMKVAQYLLSLEGMCVTHTSFILACDSNNVPLVRLLLKQNERTAYLYDEDDGECTFDCKRWEPGECCVQDWVEDGLKSARSEKADDVVEFLSKLKP